MKCPYCNKRYDVPEVVATNCACYGSNYFKLRHSCGKILSVHLRRVVRLVSVERSDKQSKQDDFGG